MLKLGFLAVAISLMSTVANADDIRWKPETLKKAITPALIKARTA